MTLSQPVAIHFKDLEPDEELRAAIETRCQALADEFHEIARMEVTLMEDGAGFEAHGHVTGKGTDVGIHAKASDQRAAADQLLDKIERQLRRVHDKRIFGQRREAQQHPPKRSSS